MALPVADVSFVCCGLPGRSAGWRHVTHVLEGRVENARVAAVVEPWFFGAGSCTPGADAFHRFRAEVQAKHPDVVFASRVADLPRFKPTALLVLASRTSEAPSHFRNVVEHGARHVYLEKPGAGSLAEIMGMRALAAEQGVAVTIGYQKNVSSYVARARAHEAGLRRNGQSPEVEFIHVNDYARADLGECFARNSEGILRNMLCHELAMAVPYWGVRAESITSITIDQDGTSFEEHGGHHDFSKIAFKLLCKDGTELYFRADRCGNRSWSGVRVHGEVFDMTEEEDWPNILRKMEENPDVMPYFIQQQGDYLTLLQAAVDAVFQSCGGARREGLVTLETAHEILAIADKLTAVAVAQCQECRLGV